MYTIIYGWSRKIVGRTIEDSESYVLAERLFKRILKANRLKKIFLHSDNGNPMKSGTMLMTLYKLGIVLSFSRPRVSKETLDLEAS